MSVSPSLSSFSVPAQFSKIFSFARSSPTSCPRSLPKPEHWLVRQDEDADQLQTLAPEFLDLRNNLNEVKGKLNRLPLERWHRHTRDVNPAGVVVARVRREANRPELLTQAWCKFTECLNKFNLVREKRRLHSVHLCEAPGAFVAALNHHLCTQQQETAKSNDVSWKWVGNTLNPYYEGNPTSQMINDDRLVMHTTDKWEFGDDDTGDVLDYENRLGLKTRITERLDGIVDLVTADGSIDCQGDPANQEGIVSALHVAEVGIALNVLSAGGSFVLKMFTFFESQSGMLLYLLAASFDEVSAFKPATSKEGNSEVYVVCKGYRDNLGEEEKDLLLKHCHEGSRLLFPPEQVPKDFVKELLACSTFFKDIQCRVIEKNLDTFNNVYDQKRMRRLQDEVASLFVDLNGVRPLEAEKRLVTRAAVQQIGQCLNLDERVEMGTFEERVAATQNEAQKVALLRKSILSFRPRNWEEFQPVEWLLSENFRSTSELSPVYGKPCSRVASSKFCPSKVIEFYQMAVAQRAKDISAGAKRRKVEFSAAPNWRPLSELLDSSEMLVKLLSIYPDVSTETKVMCGVHYDGIISYPKAMSDYLQTVVNLLDTLERGDHLIACEVPLLRRLDVAALHMVANSFEEVGFVRPRGDECALFFSEFKGDAEPTKRLLKDVMRLMDESKPNRTLLQAKRIQELIVEPAYSYVVAFNLLCLKEKSLRMLNMSEGEAEETLSGVKKTVLVLSGKGGVGKSTVAVQLALALQMKGLKVGILDIDLCGPSVPKMLNMEKREVHQCDEGWLPVFSDESQSLAVMSIGFLLNNDNEAVVWRGPKKTAMIKQFLSDVAWGERDVLIIDTPPGTSDEHITIMEALKESATKVEGAVVVTTPQAVAVGDVRRELTFCKKTGLNVIGVVENMSGYVCPNCSECTNIFSKGGGEALAEHAKVPFLGCVPIDPNLCRAAEKGDSYVKEFKDSPAAQVLMTIADRIK